MFTCFFVRSIKWNNSSVCKTYWIIDDLNRRCNANLMSKGKWLIFAILLMNGLILLYLCIAYFWALNISEFSASQYDQIYKNEKVTLSDQQISTLLKIEDPSFWKNFGIDTVTPGQGKTTITQSVVPILLYRVQLQGWRAKLQNMYLKVWRRARKIDLGRDVMALAVAQKISKEQILRIFVEQVYMGSLNNESVFGLSNAAIKYFNKSLPNLSHMEFAKLVGMIKSPDFFNPFKNPNSFEDRSKRVLKLLNGSCLPEGLFDTDYSSCL